MHTWLNWTWGMGWIAVRWRNKTRCLISFWIWFNLEKNLENSQLSIININRSAHIQLSHCHHCYYFSYQQRWFFLRLKNLTVKMECLFWNYWLLFKAFSNVLRLSTYLWHQRLAMKENWENDILGSSNGNSSG